MVELPPVRNREVIIGGGVHAQVYAATRVKMGFPKPLVLEKSYQTGGVFAARRNGFWLNSVNDAGIGSTRQGPTRMRPLSVADDLNYFPNCAEQVRDACYTEYPDSSTVASVVQANLSRYAEVITGCEAGVFSAAGREFIVNGDNSVIYEAGRLIDARGLAMPVVPGAKPGTPVVTAESYTRGNLPTGFTLNASLKRVAMIGDGDTACIVVESMLGQGPNGRPFPVSEIGWYGPSMPMSKGKWMTSVHARYLGIARHMPQDGVTGMIRPYPETGSAVNIGDAARVNGQTYDLAVYCTGYRPAFGPGDSQTPASFDFGQNGGLWRESGTGYFLIGAAASVPFRPTEYGAGDDYNKGYTRFPRNTASIFRLAPETARLAASLPDVAGGA